MIRNTGLIRIPVWDFSFSDEPAKESIPNTNDPNNTNPGTGEPPTTPVAPQSSEPKSVEQIISELKSSDEGKRAFDTIFGRGVTKGKGDHKRLPLDDTQVQVAVELFNKVKPEDVPKLLQAQNDAQNAALEKAKAEKNFNEYTERITEQHRSEIEQQGKAAETQINGLTERVKALEIHCNKLKAALTDSKITKELLSAAKAGGLIDPSDAVAQLAGVLQLNDDLEIVDGQGQVANISTMIANLVQSKPHLVGSTQSPGEGTPPQSTNQTPPSQTNSDKPTFKRSQLRDTAFYRAHETEILAAASDGRIIDDIGNKKS